MNLRILLGTFLGAAVAASPELASAASSSYYTPPKIKTRGTATTPAAGPGTVVVQVYVTSTGAPSKFKIVKSSNAGDDASALEVARTSIYVPATKGATRQPAFYDYTLKFTSSGLASQNAAASTSGIGKYKLMISGGNYAGAKAGLESYVASNPNDSAAELELGIADQYLKMPVDAAAALDKAGTIPPNDNSLAASAYSGAAAVTYQKKDYATSVGYAKKAVAISPTAGTYNSLGTAEDADGQFDAAIADLEQSRKLAAADSSMKASERAVILGNLVSAYVDGGKIDQAKVAAAEAVKIDPANTNAQAFLAQYYIKQATDADTKQNYAPSAVFFEQAAALAPAAQQPDIYARAALTYLKIKDNPPNDKAKADADKALAIAPDNALANFAAGISLANQPGKSKDAMVYLNKADASAKTGNDPQLTAAVENIIKQLNGSK